MQVLAFRSLYLAVISHSQFIKQISALAKLSQVVYPDRSTCSSTNIKDKKVKCWLCGRYYDHIVMMILHVEVVHPGEVDKYQIKNQCLLILGREQTRQKEKEKDSEGKIANGFILGMVKANTSNFSSYFGNKISKNYAFGDNSPAYLKNKLQFRCKHILTNIVAKIQRTVAKKQQVYFHSTNIFKRITPEDVDYDSEDEVGEVERELEKLRIQDFSDVNDNDKKFFILWNGFIHDRRKKMSIIYTHDMPSLLMQFAVMAQKSGIPRINLVMHAWTLWSVGQIGSSDVIKGLSEYDEAAQSKMAMIDENQHHSNGHQLGIQNKM